MIENNKLITSKNLDVTKLSAKEIAHKIRSRSLTAEFVLESFVKASKLSHASTNCITTFMLKEAFDLARDYDKKLKSEQTLSEDEYPLLGVPVSVKDMLDVEGYDTTCAFKSLIGRPARQDAAIVRILKDCGALPFCKTTVPQFGLLFETVSPLFGTTTHPLNQQYTPGGSSGGEASLLSTYGSCIGIGTDIGGSLRIPSHYCGLYTIKPTASRLGNLGMPDLSFGQECVLVSTGPMARSIEDLELFTKSVLLKEPWRYDDSIPPIKYNKAHSVSKDKKLRIGYYYSDGVFPPTPAIERAMDYTIKSLRAEGHELFEYMPTDINVAFKIFQKLMTADKFRNSKRLVAKDKVELSVMLLIVFVNIYDWLKAVAIFVLNFFGQSNISEFLECSMSISVSQLWMLQHQKKKICIEANKKWLNTKNKDKDIMDAIICPTLPIPAHKTGNFYKIFYISRYTTVYNILDYPAGVIPVTEVNPCLDGIDKNWYKKNIKDSYKNSLLHRFLYGLYHPEQLRGFPVGIQVVGRRFEEEKLLETMKTVDTCIRKSQNA